MKRFGTRQIVTIALGAIAAVFAVLGFTQLGFWDPVDGPKPGFFPGIMSTVMFVICIISFIQSFSETDEVKYEKDELLIIGCGAGIIAAAFIIGLIPACGLFVLLWMKVIEKAPWKDTIIVFLISMAIAIGVFQIWLQVQFPLGLFEMFRY